MSKVNILRVTITTDIPIDAGNRKSVEVASDLAEALIAAAREAGSTTANTIFDRVKEEAS